MRSFLLPLALLSLAGCGGFAAAPHPAPVQAVSLGGPVLASPRIQPVFFPGEDPAVRDAVVDFTTRFGVSGYYAQMTGEYGVGPATSAGPIEVTEAAPAMIGAAQIQGFVAQHLGGQDPAFPVPDESTLVVLFYPPGVTVTSFTGGVSCVDFGGFHGVASVAVGGRTLAVPFAVVPRCESAGLLHGVDALTAVTTQEIVEAVTDPQPGSASAWADVDPDHRYWARAVEDLELSDLCSLDPHAGTLLPDLPHAVQRTWSNAAAAAGQDPCVPALPGILYFQSAPVMNDTITLVRQSGKVQTKGVQIAPGGKKTIDVVLFSEESTSPWSVAVKDVATLRGQPPALSLSLDRSVGQNGDTLHLTIEVLNADPSGSEIFLVESSQGDESWHTEPGVVGR